jgi:hypothetical protein
MAYECVMKILKDEFSNLGAELSPLELVPSGKVAFCPEHGECASYAFCTTCGSRTMFREPEAIENFAEAIRFCPEHGECADDRFCGHCGERTLIHRIVTSK